LGIDVRVGELIESIDHQYPEKHVRLQFHRCTWLQHEPQPLQCAAFAWIQPEELDRYDFPAADAHLLARLRADLNLWADP
jgi:A/G-specific adenine glycosylase